MFRFTPMTGIYQDVDVDKVKNGIVELRGLVDSAIIYVRPWMIENGALRSICKHCKTIGIRLIPGMRPDLAAQGYRVKTEFRNVPLQFGESAWSDENWAEVARLMKRAMRICDTRDFFLVMEPAFDAANPPTSEQFTNAIRMAYKTGIHLIIDRPYIDHQNISRDAPWLSLVKKTTRKFWWRRPMRLAAGINYSLLANRREDDKQRWVAEDMMREIVGDDNLIRRYFVTSNGRWPGDDTQDYMQVDSMNDMFDFLDAIEHHAEDGDQPPIAYIHIDQFHDVCTLIRGAVSHA